jgi:ElaB/YqjD/DUF883 family membrane-anchored ribosome-binding protein
MNEKPVEGGSGPALAAHNKDASVPPGQTAAPEATGPTRGTRGPAEMASTVSGQVQDTARRVSSSLPNAARQARDTVAGQTGLATKQAADFISAQPLMALAVTGIGCLALGMVLGRR